MVYLVSGCTCHILLRRVHGGGGVIIPACVDYRFIMKKIPSGGERMGGGEKVKF